MAILAVPAIVAVIGVAVKLLAAYAVTRILIALGLAYVVFKGMTALMDGIKANIVGQFGALGTGLYDVVALAGGDVAISILFSAISVRLLLNPVAAGSAAVLAFKGVSPGS